MGRKEQAVREPLTAHQIDTKVSAIPMGNCLARVRLLSWVIRPLGNITVQDKGEGYEDLDGAHVA